MDSRDNVEVKKEAACSSLCIIVITDYVGGVFDECDCDMIPERPEDPANALIMMNQG